MGVPGRSHPGSSARRFQGAGDRERIILMQRRRDLVSFRGASLRGARRRRTWERVPPGRGRTWERVPGARSSGARTDRAGRHPRDGRRLRVRYPRHDRGHAGAVPYIPHATTRASLERAPGARPSGARGVGREASSRRAASPRAVPPARPWARRSRALHTACAQRAASPRAVPPARPWARRSRALHTTRDDASIAGARPSPGRRHPWQRVPGARSSGARTDRAGVPWPSHLFASPAIVTRM